MVDEQEHLAAWDFFRQGEEESFKQIYDHFFYPLLNYGIKFTKDLELAEDALQDLFTKLWRNRKSINPTNSVKNYLYKAYRRIIIAKIQAAASKRNNVLSDDTLNFDFEISYEQIKIEREELLEMRDKIQKALSLLNDRHKEILYLRFYEELSYDQIADLMGISTKSTYKLAYRALDKLRGMLQSIPLVVLLGLLKSVS